MRSRPVADNVGVYIVAIARLLRRNFDRRVQPLGLTQAQWRAIACLRREEGLNQATLAERLEVQPITAARLLDRMEAAGWIERRADPDDRRATRLYLTRKAQPMLGEMERHGAEMMEQVLDGIAPSARRELAAALRRMKENLVAAEAAAHESRESTDVRDGTRAAKRR